MRRFILGAVAFHACYVAVCVGVALRVYGRRTAGPRGWARALVTSAGLLLAGALGSAGVAALVAPPSGFTSFRYLAQGLFGETVLLLAVLAWTHRRSDLRLRGALFTAASLALLAVYAEAYHRGPEDLRIRRHPAVLPSAGTSAQALRIVHLSDIQTHEIGPYQERALTAALAERPDLIVFTGDYIQPRTGGDRARPTADFQALLRRLHFSARLGAFAVRGDVDPEWPRMFDGTEVRTLTGENVRIPLEGGRHLSLVGLTSGMSRGNERDALRRLVASVPEGDVRIVIGHQPDYVIPLHEWTRVDLALAGHTHGGQVALPLFGPPYDSSPLPRKYAGGLHDYQGTLLHVSRGIGMERGPAPQLRFLVPPEICVLDLRL
ncbi:MAG: metallophosphoesterase [Vicinamibacteria bacterium]